MPRTKKSETVSAPAPSTTEEVAPVAVEATNEVVEQQVDIEVSEEVSLSVAFTDILTQLNSFRSQITSLSAQLRSVRSRAEREIRQAQKTSKKRKATNRKPSGFVKPALISTELAAFLSKPKGTEMARTEVTREINAYIREHNLQNPENRRFIVPDAKLRKLLKLKKEDELSYFNLQKFMSPHFTKVEAPATA
jgi:chromatin remodeling complex protein RSC6